VRPATATLTVGDSLDFGVAPAGTDVVWSVAEGAAGGAITSAGLYTAPTQPGTYHVLAASKQDPSITARADVTAFAAPSIASFSAAPALVFAGGSVTLSFTFSGGAGSIQPGLGPVTSGTPVTLKPAATTTYTLVVTNAAGKTATAAATASVSTAPAIATFAASPPQIQAGQSSTLSWSISGATSASIGPGIGAVNAVSGSRTVSPGSTTTYTLTATGAAGQSVTASSVVTVAPATGGAPVISSFSASPSTVMAGQTVTLSWSVTGATSMSVDGGVGNVTGSSVNVTPSVTSTYTLTATNTSGTATAAAIVTVLQPPVIQSFTANPQTVPLGLSTTLQWTASNALSLSIDNGIGTVTGTSRSVTPSKTTTYLLTASNTVGSVSASTTVTVVPAVAVAVAPKTASVSIAGTTPFSATVSNTTDTAVSWSVQEAGGGTISAGGVYTAPAVTGTYHVMATSHADPTKNDTATVTVVAMAVAPAAWTMLPGTTRVFGITPAGSTPTWSVVEAAGGTVDQTGLYTAPLLTGTYHVKALLPGGTFATAAVTVSSFSGLAPVPNPIVSRFKPVFASPSDVAGYLTDGRYSDGHFWLGGRPSVANPSWAAIKIGTGYSKVLLSWTASASFNYDETDFGSPDSYDIQVSGDSTNGADGSWATVASASNVQVRTRAHSFDFTGKSWVKMVIKSTPANSQTGVQIDEIDVHDLSAGGNDTWFFFGDSITALWADRSDDPAATHQPSFAALVNHSGPAHFPAMIDGGHGGEVVSGALANLDTFLAWNPDYHYWGISFGMNDSSSNNQDTASFRTGLQSMIDRLKAAGKVPVLARIPYAKDGAHNFIPQYNAVIDDLTVQNGLLPGPDSYAYFIAHQTEYMDLIHPNDTGCRSWNRLWYLAMQPLFGP